jgi:hypothetical protein
MWRWIMKRMIRYTVVFGLILLFAASAVVLAADQRGRYGSGEKASPEELLAALQTVKGTLAEENGWWKLDAGKNVYFLHFGSWDYLAGTGIPLEEGKAITIEGGVFDGDIVVFTANLGGKTYAFRDKSGVPLWAKYGTRAGRGPDGDEYGWGRRGGRGCCGGKGRDWNDRDDDCYGWRGRGGR